MLRKNKLPPGIMSPSRRSMLQRVLAGVAALSAPCLALAGAAAPQITVWKTPNCGCCKAWVAYLRANGFEVVTHDVKDNAPFRQKLGLPEQFGSCHTASLGGYVLEGHVPVAEIRRLLRDKPVARGLAVPGMPTGAPGMEMGGAHDAYNVLLVLMDGKSRVYQSYPSGSALKS